MSKSNAQLTKLKRTQDTAIPPRSPVIGYVPPRIRMAQVGSVVIYQVKENELEKLEKGASVNIKISMSSFLISAALTSLTTLCSSEFTNPNWNTFFLVLLITSGLLGFTLLVLGLLDRSDNKAIIKTIRERPQIECDMSEDSSNPITPK